MDETAATPAPPEAPPPPPSLGLLRFSLLGGALFDAAAGLWALLDVRGMAAVLGVDPPGEPHTFRFLGLLLCGLALFYLVAAAEIRRSLRGVGAAVAIRTLGGLYVAGYALVDAAVPRIFIAFGLADLAFAAIHYGLLRNRAGRGAWSALLRG